LRDEIQMKQLNDYRTLGRTGLKVSPLGLGVMTYGWGADKNAARDIFNLYRERGGNFFDTADMYSNGESEAWLGEFIHDANARDEAVIGTKFSFCARSGNPNAGGNGRKNIYRALEGSLRRLKTDYVDVYILHAWDCVTPVEEVMSTLNDLVRTGRVRHIGFSNAPAWYAARAQTLAEERDYERLALLQLEYSLISRNLGREHVPLARETGISIVAVESAGQRIAHRQIPAQGRKNRRRGPRRGREGIGQFGAGKIAKREKNWEILDMLLAAAKKIGKTPAEVALAWVIGRPQVTSVLVGATKKEQLDTNLSALALELPPEIEERLTAMSQSESTELDHFFEPALQGIVHGGVTVRRGVV
jgi:aryl-alcohol dehydrogenase-like predicted oxidoreductase